MPSPLKRLRIGACVPVACFVAVVVLPAALAQQPPVAATSPTPAVATAPVDNARRDAQRAAFRVAYAAAQRGGDAWQALATGLTDYPLYPYLQAAALEHDLRQLDSARVSAYLRRYPDLIPAADLRRHFLRELARRKDWGGFLALYRPGLGDTLACDALQARLARGETLQFDRDLADLWKQPSLPDACNPVQTWAHDHGLLTTTRLWARIDAAVHAGKGGTVAALAGWLDGADADAAQRLAQALRSPAAATAAALGWPDTPRSRQAATLALERQARRDSDGADAAWARLRDRLQFDTAQRYRIMAALALYRATDFDAQALQRLAALPAAAQTDATRAWRVRVALARQDWPAALQALDALGTEQKQDNEWRYFRARALGALGRTTEAHTLFTAVAGNATYFGFLAADRSGQPYAVCPMELAGDPAREQALLARPGLTRAFELFAVGLLPAARREWARALDGADADTVRLAADLANRNGWYDRAIFAFSSGDALRLYAQRFPLARQDGVTAQAADAGIDPAWAYAIIRAESAWMPDAHSGADARGLMQLLPGTAKLVSRRQGIPFDGNLYEPRTNIALGTHYLAHMAARYGGAPWLASAAYNAGPGRVDQWLEARGALPPDLFIATIPFHETREYVARVLAFSVIYDWRLHGQAVPMTMRMPRYGEPYTPPTVATTRKAVVCPTANAVATGDTPVTPVRN
jgi:soluble lytic murein transglycosylase